MSSELQAETYNWQITKNLLAENPCAHPGVFDPQIRRPNVIYVGYNERRHRSSELRSACREWCLLPVGGKNWWWRKCSKAFGISTKQDERAGEKGGHFPEMAQKTFQRSKGSGPVMFGVWLPGL